MRFAKENIYKLHIFILFYQVQNSRDKREKVLRQQTHSPYISKTSLNSTVICSVLFHGNGLFYQEDVWCCFNHFLGTIFQIFQNLPFSKLTTWNHLCSRLKYYWQPKTTLPLRCWLLWTANTSLQSRRKLDRSLCVRIISQWGVISCCCCCMQRSLSLPLPQKQAKSLHPRRAVGTVIHFMQCLHQHWQHPTIK